MSDELWVCHACQMIGSYADAWAHHQQAGHDVEPLPEDVAQGVREEWGRQQAKRAADLISFLRFRERAARADEGQPTG